MKRFHLLELEDQPWFPAVIRDGGTDFLGFIFNTFQLYRPAVPFINEVLARTGITEVVDLCSGNGGPVESMSKLMGQQNAVRFTLSDKFPNLGAYRNIELRTNQTVNYIEKSVDVLETEDTRTGLRTMFSAVHHFQPHQVQEIIRKITVIKMPLAFFDGGSRSWLMILLVLIGHPIMFLLFTPFVRPFKWSRLFFTYLLPLIPLYAIWDGIVSILRLHTPEQLAALAYAADKDRAYDWKHGKTRNGLGVPISYLIGTPK